MGGLVMLKTCITVGVMTASAAASYAFGAEQTAERQPVPAALDLKAPKIGEIFTPEQIEAVLARAIDPALEHIEVEALPLGDLPLEDEGAALAEEVARTVAWLIFGSRANPVPDATDSHRPPPPLATNYNAAFKSP
jgi:hypothetical protein